MKISYFDSMKNREKLFKVGIFVLLCFGSLLFLSPLWRMISTSLKTMKEVMSFPPTFFLEVWKWDNYSRAWPPSPFVTYKLNTLSITVLVVLGQVVISSFVAYGFANIAFRWRNVLLASVL